MYKTHYTVKAIEKITKCYMSSYLDWYKTSNDEVFKSRMQAINRMIENYKNAVRKKSYKREIERLSDEIAISNVELIIRNNFEMIAEMGVLYYKMSKNF